MMESPLVNNFENSQLHIEDINLIGSTNLSMSEKHHLRMLLHCLKCFKSMSEDEEEGQIPRKEVWLEWCLQNPIMFPDDEFIQVLFDQLSGAAIQLEKLATTLKVAPLHLTLKDLIDAYVA